MDSPFAIYHVSSVPLDKFDSYFRHSTRARDATGARTTFMFWTWPHGLTTPPTPTTPPGRCAVSLHIHPYPHIPCPSGQCLHTTHRYPPHTPHLPQERSCLSVGDRLPPDSYHLPPRMACLTRVTLLCITYLYVGDNVIAGVCASRISGENLAVISVLNSVDSRHRMRYLVSTTAI